jgi:hypothetical protein
MKMKHEHSNKPELIVDNDPFNWEKDTITGAEIRVLAGLPDDVQVFQHIPGHQDKEILADTVVNLDAHKGPERFSTQAPGSKAG